mmetsp:Transcript_14610/g.34351  ORF Transcript_14610/g.34351 Transcript_14610/m.34351 type:complete len:479 (+) Transcript_14610:177-1613(+)
MPMSLPIFDGMDTTDRNVSSIVSAFRQDGLVCFRLLTQDECDDLILEQWKKILWKQPWLPVHKLRVQDEIGRQLHMERDRDAFLKAVKGPLSTERRKHYEEGWCLHRGFGACCDPVVFHLPGVWKLRQSPQLYEIAARLSGNRKLWVDINRSIQKLPGQGDNEFLHWDFNPFNEDSHSDPNHVNVSGKVCYTKSRFVAAPGTHTSEFLADFVSKYRAVYPDVRTSSPKLGLDPQKADPLELFARRKEFCIPAGCAVLWSDRLLHGQVKTPLTEEVEYGCYIGFLPAGSRAAYKAVSGVEELEDRLASYHNGHAPKLWPSLDRIHFYPARFKNFPNLLESYLRKMPPDHPMITTRVTSKGKTVRDLIPLSVPHYAPPPLSALGKRLLGLTSWDDVDAWDGMNEPRSSEPRAAKEIRRARPSQSHVVNAGSYGKESDAVVKREEALAGEGEPCSSSEAAEIVSEGRARKRRRGAGGCGQG